MALPAHRTFACDSSSASAVRDFVVAAVEGLDVDIDALKLCVSELATNAVRHAATSFEVAVSSTAAGVRVEVADGEPRPPVLGSPTGSGGFGLGIVDTLAHTWGYLPRGAGKVVWCELVPAHVEVHDPPGTSPSSEATYGIGAVSRMVGTAPATLRAWEHAHGVVVPSRTDTGHRIYTREQVDELRFVVARLADGDSVAEAHRQLAAWAGSVSFVPAAPDVSMLVLLAERDPYAARLAEYFLRTEGFEVTVALDVDDARRLSLDAPGVAIVELLIEGGAGLDLCRELAAASIPVVAVSSLALGDAAIAAGAGAFVAKPIDSLQLVSAVRDLTGTSAMTRSTADIESHEPADR